MFWLLKCITVWVGCIQFFSSATSCDIISGYRSILALVRLLMWFALGYMCTCSTEELYLSPSLSLSLFHTDTHSLYPGWISDLFLDTVGLASKKLSIHHVAETGSFGEERDRDRKRQKERPPPYPKMSYFKCTTHIIFYYHNVKIPYSH